MAGFGTAPRGPCDRERPPTAADGGDHLRPNGNGNGMRVMAGTVDIRTFSRDP
ncbi:hypothetical protein [Streptomyces lushanensis]|uniref:hypothetical protein n=1 Tax=Streptomyces lushanensis TaxID=1434255 RepID=UPI001475ED9C|nr:hypothetical protein [Streptomyces lushanensis]